jgi:hypothetical protein
VAITHGSLSAGTESHVSHPRDVRKVGVMHKGNSSDPIYVTINGTATIRGADCFTILPGQRRWVPRIWSAGAPTIVSLISATAVDYELEYP